MAKRYLVALTAFALTAGFATAATGATPPDRSARGAVDSPLEAHQGHSQDGGTGGHLPPAQSDVELVGKLRVHDAEPGVISDVSTHGDFAYLGRFATDTSCNGGVYVVDISDPSVPEEVGFIPAHAGSFVSEGVQAVGIRTKFFRGDILVHNNEICADGGLGGMSIWDVSDPLNPQPLAENVGDDDGTGDPAEVNQIHSAFAWQAGNHAYAVMVDDEEFEDVDIMDITDPRHPVQIGEFDLNVFEVDQPDIGLVQSFLHDVVVKRVGGHFIMLLSYWDGGYIQLNVDDPANPVFLGDTEFTNPDPELLEQTGAELTPEGNAHQAEFSRDNRFFLAADEDFAPFRTSPLTITTGPLAGNEYTTVPVGGAAPVALLADKKLNGPVAYGGYGCPGTSTPIPSADSIFPPGSLEPGEEQIVVLQRGPSDDPNNPEGACFPGEKADNATDAGWDAVVFVNRHLGDAALDEPPFCGSGAFPGDEQIVAVCTTHTAFHEMFGRTPDFTVPYPLGDPGDLEPDIAEIGEEVEATAIFDGWGYVHLFDAGSFQEVDTFAVPEAMDPSFATDFGALSVHEVATDPKISDLAYLSYYSAGFRVIRFGPSGIEEVGAFIDVGGNDFWGVEVAEGRGRLILASDRDSGLYLFRFTGQPH